MKITTRYILHFVSGSDDGTYFKKVKKEEHGAAPFRRLRNQNKHKPWGRERLWVYTCVFECSVT